MFQFFPNEKAQKLFESVKVEHNPNGFREKLKKLLKKT